MSCSARSGTKSLQRTQQSSHRELTGNEGVVAVRLPRSEAHSCEHPGSKLRVVTPGAYELEVRIPKQVDLDIFVDALRQAGISIWRLARKEQTLEEVFIGIVGGAV